MANVLLTVAMFLLQFGGVYTIKIIINHFQGETFYDLPLLYLGIAFLVFRLGYIFLSWKLEMSMVINEIYCILMFINVY